MSYQKLWLPHLYTMESKKWIQRWVAKSVWCKMYQDFGGNIFLLSISWVYILFRQTFGLISGTSVRGTVGLILMRKYFNYFNFYRQIDRFNRRGKLDGSGPQKRKVGWTSYPSIDLTRSQHQSTSGPIRLGLGPRNRRPYFFATDFVFITFCYRYG